MGHCRKYEHGKAYAGCPGYNSKHHALREYLHDYVTGLCSDGPSYAYLLSTFFYNYPHYVAYADYTGHKRTESYKQHKYVDTGKHIVDHLKLFGNIHKSYGLTVIGMNRVCGAQYAFYFGL